MEKDLIEYIAKSLVDDPSAVSVNEVAGERGPVLELSVAQNDIGKVIGIDVHERKLALLKGRKCEQVTNTAAGKL